MVAPALIAAAWNMPGTPEYWKELAPESAALLVEFGGADDAALDAHVVARARAPRASNELLQPAEFTRDARAGRARLDRARGAVRARRPAAPARHGADRRGRLRPPGADRRVRRATCRRCSAKHGFLPGVAGHASAGNLHFQLTPDFSKPEDLERYEAFMERARRADRGQVRRLAEGRARHRREHGAVRRARVGRRRRRR